MPLTEDRVDNAFEIMMNELWPSTTPMRCAPVGRPVFLAAWARRHPAWAPYPGGEAT